MELNPTVGSGLFYLISSDLKRKQDIFLADGADVAMWKIFLSDGTSANILYRLMQFCSKGWLLPLAMILQFINKLLNHCVIGVKVNFSSGFVLMHPVGVVINSKVAGGVNVTLESGVVIGDTKGESPILGSNIFVGAGAKIIGGLTVGDGVNIGANAVVVKDVPNDMTAVGIPAKLLTRSE